MTAINYSEDPRDASSELQDPGRLSDAEIEMMEWLQDQEDLEKTVPSAAERNRTPQMNTDELLTQLSEEVRQMRSELQAVIEQQTPTSPWISTRICRPC